jgi:hypothetical protein
MGTIEIKEPQEAPKLLGMGFEEPLWGKQPGRETQTEGDI